MHELREMLVDELNKCTQKGELSPGSLDVVDKLTHSIKSIDTILAMEDAGYSNDYSYARGRGARRDSMGRYSRRYDDSRSYGRYSRDDAKADLMDTLHEVSESTSDNKVKRMIQNWMNEAESM